MPRVPPVTTAPKAGAAAGSEALDDCDIGRSPALAHRLQTVAAAAGLGLVQGGRHQAGAGRAERVAQRYRAAEGVDAVEVRAGLMLPGEHHRYKRLVYLDQVDVVHRQARFGQGVERGGNRAGEHVDRVVGPDAEVVDAGARAQAVLADRLLRGDQQGGRAVGDLAGQGRGDDAARLEGG